MARRVFLHVGTPKSGTSFLQGVVHGEKQTLSEQGLLVPLGPAEHFRATQAVREIADPESGSRSLGTRAWRALVDATRAWPGDVLITHELLAGADAGQVGRAVSALHPADVHVIITARDLLRQIPAEWQEHVKHGATTGLDDFVRAVTTGGAGAAWFWRVQDVADLAGRWAHQVDSANVHIVTVPPRGAAPDVLWKRFASVVGIDPDSCRVEAERSNESLGAVEVEFLRRVHLNRGKRFRTTGQHNLFKDRLAHRVLSQHEDLRRFGINQEAQRWAVERSTAMVEELSGAGYSLVGNLDDLIPPGFDLAADPGEVTADELAAVGVDTTVALLAMLRDELARVDRLRGQLDGARAQADGARAQADDAGARARDAEARAQEASTRAADTAQELQRWARRPIREKLIASSAERRQLMRLRTAYWKAAHGARRIRRRLGSAG